MTLFCAGGEHHHSSQLFPCTQETNGTQFQKTTHCHVSQDPLEASTGNTLFDESLKIEIELIVLQAVSTLASMGPDTNFLPVIPDDLPPHQYAFVTLLMTQTNSCFV